MLDDFSIKVSRRFNEQNEETEVFFDPATALIVTKIVIEVIKTVHSCRKNSNQSLLLMRFPNNNDERVLRKIVRKHLGWWKDLRFGKKLTQDILEERNYLTDDEILKIYKENI